MTPEEVHRMPVDQHRSFVRYQNHTVKEWERRK
jgi:hypothetical protein